MSEDFSSENYRINKHYAKRRISNNTRNYGTDLAIDGRR